MLQPPRGRWWDTDTATDTDSDTDSDARDTRPDTGGLSGATPGEAVSWGKIDPENLPDAFGAPDLAVSRWGTVKVDFRTQMSNLPGVFAAGDIVRGASLVVWAIRDGRDAAKTMHEWMQQAAMAVAAE